MKHKGLGSNYMMLCRCTSIFARRLVLRFSVSSNKQIILQKPVSSLYPSKDRLVTLNNNQHLEISTIGFSKFNNRTFSKYSHHIDLNNPSFWSADLTNKRKKRPSDKSRKTDSVSLKTFSVKQEDILTSQLESLSNASHEVKNEEWKAVKCQVLDMVGDITEENIDAIVIARCSHCKYLQLGKSFFNHLKALKGQMNRAIYGNYLKLFFDCSSQCSNEDLIEIKNVYQELLRVYPVLDSYTAEKAVFALCLTDTWKEYKQLFKMIEMFYPPSKPVYAAVIKTAFKNKETSLGWELMEEMQCRGLSIPDEVFIYLLEALEYSNKDDQLAKVLGFLSKFNVKLSLNLCEVLKKTHEDIDRNRKGTYTTVLRRGECKNCHAQLEPACVSQEDYEELKSAFLNPVLIGKDIFQKTRPEEFNSFLQYLKNSSPYDVVLDGLNIALKMADNKKSPNVCAFQLKSVVQHFVAKNKKVLVLGRKHMTKWPVSQMNHIYENAHVFLAEDLSQDDPFLLYATLYSGLGTGFVSQDMMRGHKFLLTVPKLQLTFQRWQAQHQYFLSYIENNGTVHLREPVPFLQSIQKNLRGDWHVPYTVRENLDTKVQVDMLHRKWLCLTSQATRQQQKQPAGNEGKRKYQKFTGR